MTIGLPERVGVVGLGYVGLPLAAALARHFSVVGFDVDVQRVQELRKGVDRNREVSRDELVRGDLRFTDDEAELKGCEAFVVTVPTPVDAAKRPDLSALVEASRTVGRCLGPGVVVVYESTVYPGCTEEVCVPILEQVSGLSAGRDFKVGYSPERINPGDDEHCLETVVKVVAGQDSETTEFLAAFYGKVVKAGIHKAPNIRTAEAAKVIENVQRDLNIALMNELAMLFNQLGLETHAVLEAARTKWNFLDFRPGLVGGHCIPVDPYYLTHKAQEVGYHPEVILAGRRVNDGMGRFVAEQTVKLLIQAGHAVNGSKVLVLGVTFKENVPDTRNSRVLDLVRELEGYGCAVSVHDPLVSDKTWGRLGLVPVENPFGSGTRGEYDAVVLAVPHREFRERGWKEFLSLLNNSKPGLFVDVKGVFSGEAKAHGDPHEWIYWSL